MVQTLSYLNAAITPNTIPLSNSRRLPNSNSALCMAEVKAFQRAVTRLLNGFAGQPSRAMSPPNSYSVYDQAQSHGHCIMIRDLALSERECRQTFKLVPCDKTRLQNNLYVGSIFWPYGVVSHCKDFGLTEKILSRHRDDAPVRLNDLIQWIPTDANRFRPDGTSRWTDMMPVVAFL